MSNETIGNAVLTLATIFMMVVILTPLASI